MTELRTILKFVVLFVLIVLFAIRAKINPLQLKSKHGNVEEIKKQKIEIVRKGKNIMA